MAAISTIIAGAALGLGAASTVVQAKSASNARKDQKAANKRQETQAKEAAALDPTRRETGASLVFGTSRASDELLKRDSRRNNKSSGKVASPIGGL